MSPSLLVSHIEQMVIACEKYFNYIYRGELFQVCVRGICCSKFFVMVRSRMSHGSYLNCGRGLARYSFVYIVSMGSEDSHRA